MATTSISTSTSASVKCSAAIALYRQWLATAGLEEKEHQLDGIRWCLEREMGNDMRFGVRGGIVADEMGLGKTILMLGCIISNFRGRGGNSRTLVVLPLSLVQQWSDVMGRFLGHEPMIYHGARVKKISAEKLEEAAIVLTTYGMISKREKKSPLWGMRWNRLIFDEAHHMRNSNTRIFQGCMKLEANIKWLVTGTPIQNRKTDFYSLCAVLGLETAFYANPANIPEIIRWHLLRRTKKSVGIQLPPLSVENITVDWKSEDEQHLAAQIHALAHFNPVTLANVDMVIANLCGGGNCSLPVLTRARQICISPHLLQQAIGRMKAAGHLAPDVQLRSVKTCSKIMAIVDHIRQSLKENFARRKMIFCHYRGEIDLLEAMFRRFDISVATVDGRTARREKQMAFQTVISKQEWCSISKTFRARECLYDIISPFLAPQVMLVQIQTASEGLNMQHFHDIYFTSPHWNPALEDQAIARSHRIGQSSKVKAYRFMMRAFDSDDGDDGITLDQYCYKVQQTKRELMKIFDE